MQPTIKLGDRSEAVKVWQGIVGVTKDGIFGANTKTATILWQSKHGLTADGVVGPKTWAAAGMNSAPSAPSAPSANDVDVAAWKVVQATTGLTDAEKQYALTVAKGEGGYGSGWAYPSQRTIDDSARFGLTGYEGKGSNNWGAEQGTGDAGSFQHVDYHSDGTTYVGKYRKYSSPSAGFAGFVDVLFSGGLRGAYGATAIKKAIATGDIDQAVKEQRLNGYFELALDKYQQAVRSHYDALTAKLGWKPLFSGKA